MSKIVVLSFSEEEEKACQRLLQIISESSDDEKFGEIEGLEMLINTVLLECNKSV